MTRAATNGLLPNDTRNGQRSKHPQPVLDLLPSGVQEGSVKADLDTTQRPRSAPRANSHGQDSDSSDDEGLQIGARRRKPQLSRARSDFGPRVQDQTNGHHEEEGGDEVKMRHGWEAQLESPDKANLLSQTFFMYFEDKRHETAGNPAPIPAQHAIQEWRMRDRLKTVSAILAVCLNIGVDPPDVIKTNPCARLECWIDPVVPDAPQSSSNPMNAQIGKNLQTQYENLSMRTRYKLVMDPTIEEMKKYCQSLRRTAREERILFHYNGHGVPKPTPSGEIWVFNRSYTQYIPISLYDLQDWLQAPSLFVYDCSSAGLIIKNFHESAAKHHNNEVEARKKDPQRPIINYGDCIHLAACRENETLPTNPDLPADIFTSCLTTPINMAVRFFILQNPLKGGVTLAEGRNIPGKVSERRTPLGELNWIFTAITDTIAWNCLPKPLFKKLFRQDLMVAALFRNFLLAQRVMRIYHCHPQCHPEIPATHNHPLWQSWDLAVEMILAQLPKLIEQSHEVENVELDYQHSEFFADQLSAFEVYLGQGAIEQKIPEQLPIVLQVLLSQVHRLRALILLSKFLDLGPWAVNLALSIGIFPYVLKLLQSQAIELKPVMVFIWARILAVDQSCQNDLVKDNGYVYFTAILNSSAGIPIGNVAEHRAMCAFVIAMFCKDFRVGQEVILRTTPELIDSLLNHILDMENPLLRQFCCLCLAHMWHDYTDAKWAAVASNAHLRLCDLAQDPVPEVRAAALYALTSFVGIDTPDAAQASQALSIEETVASIIMAMTTDGSIMVRKELAIFYSAFVAKHKTRFAVACWDQLNEEQELLRGEERERSNGHVMTEVNGAQPRVNGQRRTSVTRNTVFAAVWRQVMIMSTDPHREVSQNASAVMDFVLNALLDSPLGSHASAVLNEILNHGTASQQQPTSVNTDGLTRQRSIDRPRTPPSPTASTASKTDGYFSAGLRRTASVAASMKNLAIFGSARTPAESSTPPSPTRESGRLQQIPHRPKGVTSAETLSLPPDALDNVPGPPHQPPAKVPSSPGFQSRDTTALPSLPLKSRFFDWSASYFREPQMRPSEADEPGSLDYNERLWRRNRNDRIIASTQPLKEVAGTGRWDMSCGYFGIGAAPVKMVFHQFENHLVTSDDHDSIAVWDWEKAHQLCRFSNGNPAGSRITQLRFINEDDQAMLMTGSSDGIIKVYRNYESLKGIELAASFRALTDLVPSNQTAGLVFDWQQGQGRILVAGDERVIRVWQAGHELCILDIPARSGSCITSLTSDQVEGNVFVAGFGNGAVRAYDQRMSPRDSMVMQWKEHKSWIVGCHLQRGGMRELISAESSGGVRLWDLRMTKSVGGVEGRGVARGLRTLSVHEHAPVFAT